ncbi:S1C family serine protease [Mesobacillus harenae]|uniref:S1C family serine protease n=1 Tax=Mesobacillus harenae TaxID=2213203 RepID=UPI00157FCBD1|nr:trypsin-like peptidase domain-containing protein [Mesobacillus harenae]
MTDFNENDQIRAEVYKKDRKPSRLRGGISTVTAGIVGSLLTLAIVPQTDFFKDVYPITSPEAVEIAQNTATAGNSTIPIQTSAKASSGSIADMVENSSKAIVGVVNIKQRNNNFSNQGQNVESGSGSGVIFKKAGDSAYIVTNNHVIEGASDIEISLYNGEKTSAQVVGADALTDLAVLKMDADKASSIIEFGDSSSLRPGEQVWAIGNPLGLELSRTVTQGIVSAVDRSIAVTTSAGEWDLNVIQTDAAINPGNSGGALINANGEVIGINSLKIANGAEGLGFAIPSNDLLPIVNEMIETGQVSRPYIGISMADLAEIPPVHLQGVPADVKGGTMITYIDPDSPAAKAGLKVKDLIVSLNNTDIGNSSDLRKYLYTKVKDGENLKVEVYRDGELVTLTLTLKSKSA